MGSAVVVNEFHLGRPTSRATVKAGPLVAVAPQGLAVVARKAVEGEGAVGRGQTDDRLARRCVLVAEALDEAEQRQPAEDVPGESL